MYGLKKSLRTPPALILASICCVSFVLMLWGAYTDSAIVDEVAHIPAGYAYVHNLDYRLNPEHPPLVKALAALPLLWLNPHFPTDDPAWTNDVNSEWVMGGKLLYGGSGNDADQIIRWARIGPILLTLLLVALLYFWARTLLDAWWALLPALLFALSPTVLAHGHYVTTDIGAALGATLAICALLAFLRKPSPRRLIFAGLAFGIAIITKFSTALLIPYFIILILAFCFIIFFERRKRNAAAQAELSEKNCWYFLKSLAAIFVIGYAAVVYPAYFLFTARYPIPKQAADTEILLNSFASTAASTNMHMGRFCAPMRCLAEADLWMAKNPVTRPFAEYLLGMIMVLQRTAGENITYFWNHVSDTGSWFYFPVVYLLKEPLPTLLIVCIAIMLGILAAIKKIFRRHPREGAGAAHYLKAHFAEFSLLVFVILYWAWSMRSPLNIGFRHLLPTLPFIYILAAHAWKHWLTEIRPASGKNESTPLRVQWQIPFRVFLKYAFLFFLIAWLSLETLFAAPYFLSYFNEFAGGTGNGYRYVTDSNYDWGQDMLRFKDFVAAHPEIDKIAVDYFGGANPKYYLGDASNSPGSGKEVDWSSSRGNPADQGIHWLAVSVNVLQIATEPLASGTKRTSQDEYGWLTALRPPETGPGQVSPPDYKAGTSIFIYKL